MSRDGSKKSEKWRMNIVPVGMGKKPNMMTQNSAMQESDKTLSEEMHDYVAAGCKCKKGI